MMVSGVEILGPVVLFWNSCRIGWHCACKGLRSPHAGDVKADPTFLKSLSP